jgi:hypothetical protein
MKTIKWYFVSVLVVIVSLFSSCNKYANENLLSGKELKTISETV